jgi:protein-tyrosine phosphatase
MGQNELVNFRDFGGLPTESGRHVRPDRLYRSGQFFDLPAGALAFALQLDFEVIVDLRDAKERRSAPSPWPSNYQGRLLLHDSDPTGVPPHLALLGSDTLTPGGIVRYYESLYATLPFDPLYRELFARALLRLTDASGRVLIHCAVGKDRTGVLCALILSALGVARESIMADFLRSSKAPSLEGLKRRAFEWARQHHGQEITQSTVDALLDVEPAYLQAAFQQIERRCGSVAGYWQESGVSAAITAQLRDRFTA